MIDELVVLARAEEEILEAYIRFEDAREGLGDRFSLTVEKALDQIAKFPESGPLYAAPYRRVAVIDLRQDPEQIRTRLG